MFSREVYVMVLWPDVQLLMELEGYNDHVYATSDEEGGGIWFVELNWLLNNFITTNK